MDPLPVDAAVPIGAAVLTASRDFRCERRNLIGEDLDSLLAYFHASLDKDRIVRIQELYAFAINIRPRNDFDKSAFVFKIEAAVTIALFGILQLEGGYHTANFYLPGGGFFFQIGNRSAGDFLNEPLILVQRMARDVEAERL